MVFDLKNIAVGLLLALLFSNCEATIDLDLDNSEPQLVIEGQLTDHRGKHQVRITRTVPFDQPNVFPAVSGAFVTIGDNTGLLDTLREAAPGIYETQRLLQGVYGRTYTLRVGVEGRQYEAMATMPQRVLFDTLTVANLNLRGTLTQTLLPEFTDPIGLGNYYYFVVFKNGQRQSRTYTFEDALSDGRRIARPLSNPDLKLQSGDTCKVDLYCLDPEVFKYFLTLQLSSGSTPGGGTTPANPDNNFGNACLGYFSAHPLQSKTVVIQ